MAVRNPVWVKKATVLAAVVAVAIVTVVTACPLLTTIFCSLERVVFNPP
jgi:hypothetical protein